MQRRPADACSGKEVVDKVVVTGVAHAGTRIAIRRGVLDRRKQRWVQLKHFTPYVRNIPGERMITIALSFYYFRNYS